MDESKASTLLFLRRSIFSKYLVGKVTVLDIPLRKIKALEFYHLELID